MLATLCTRSIQTREGIIVKALDCTAAIASRDALAKTIYSRLFDWYAYIHFTIKNLFILFYLFILCTYFLGIEIFLLILIFLSGLLIRSIGLSGKI